MPPEVPHTTTMPLPTIIVIDDEPLMLRVMTRTLSTTFELATFASPVDALLHLGTACACDAVISDVHFPAMTVEVFYERLRLLRPELSSRVIFVTGSDASSEAADFLKEHADHLLLKPFRADDLLGLLRQVIANP